MVGRGGQGFGERSLDQCLTLAASFLPPPRVGISPAPSRAPLYLSRRSARSWPGCASPGSDASCGAGNAESVGAGRGLCKEGIAKCSFSDHELTDRENWELKSKGRWARCLWTWGGKEA